MASYVGHLNADRYYEISEIRRDVPKFDRQVIREYQCIPCITASIRRSKITNYTCVTTRPLELVHLDISGKVEASPQKYMYASTFLDDFTAESDDFLLKTKTELYNFLSHYKAASERELEDKNYRPSAIRLDGAGENTSNIAKLLSGQNGI